MPIRAWICLLQALLMAVLAGWQFQRGNYGWVAVDLGFILGWLVLLYLVYKFIRPRGGA